MAFTHRVTEQYEAGGKTVGQTVDVSADAEDNREITVASAAADLLVNIAVDVDQLAGLLILADQDLTIKVNDPVVADQTIDLDANVPITWHSGSVHACPLGQDVTSLYVTNDGGVETMLYVRVLQDSTP